MKALLALLTLVPALAWGQGYIPGAGGIKLSDNNVWTGTQTFGVALRAPTGTVTFPAISSSSDADTGMYWISNDNLGFATNSTNRLTIHNTGATLVGTLTTTNLLGSGAASMVTIRNSATNAVGLYINTVASQTADTLRIEVNGANNFLVTSAGGVTHGGTIMPFTTDAAALGSTTRFYTTGFIRQINDASNNRAKFGATSFNEFYGSTADGSGAVGNKIGNNTALTTDGAKILALYSNAGTTERLSVEKSGVLVLAAGADGVSGTATLVGGTVTVSTTAVEAGDKIFLSYNTPGGTPGVLSQGTITADTSFVINSSSGSDTSTVNWWIVR